MKGEDSDEKLFRDWINDSCTHPRVSQIYTFVLNQRVRGDYA